MTEEFKESLEEVFVEKHFILSDEIDDIKKNLYIAKDLYIKNKNMLKEYAEQIENGEYWDESSFILAIQNMVFADRYHQEFEKELLIKNR